MQMIFFKACSKCQGDLYLDKDMYGQYLRCLQCGFMKDVADKHEITGSKRMFSQKKAKAA